MIVLLTHYGVNLILLEGWAAGSIILFSNTYWTTIITLLSISLVTGTPEMMMAPKSTRQFMFGTSLLTLFTFFGNAGMIMYRYMTGSTPTDSIS